jgi:signal transduction histidine kinase
VEGKILGIRSTIQDITDRKRAEEGLIQSEENARQLARENATMAELGRIITSTLNIDEIYQSFTEEVEKIISFDRIVINVIDTEKNTVKNVYIAGKELHDRNVKDIYPLEGSGNAEMVRTKSTLLIQTEDFNEYKDRFPMLLSTFQAGFRSIMNVPLFSKGKVMGGLLLRSHKPYAYTDKDVKLAERIGSQIVGAIANAQLYIERIQAEQEREALQEQLRQSQKMEAIGRLAGGIAHDFNNLLTVIKGYSQLSLVETKEDDPLKENLEEIKKAAEKAADLTRQLLAFSRRQILEMKVLDLNTILGDLDKMLHRLIGEDIELVTLLPDALGRVKTDPGWVEQIIMNLAVNARDAMPKGGKLTIETANVELDEAYARGHIAVKPGRYVMLSVSDTGVGMTAEIRQQVFEPFFTTKERGKGTGLGLSTVYGIVKQSGGNIWVYSEPGQGTTFKIYLPRVDEPLEELKERVVKEELLQGKETVLVVEDEEAVRQLAVRILKRQGYTVLDTPDGEGALVICEKQKEPVHLILTDVIMPGMSGRQLAERCRRIRQDFKVLYMSGYTDNAIVHHGVLEEGMNYIQKPFTVEDLARKVREVLDK